jgi:hypothetical protein
MYWFYGIAFGALFGLPILIGGYAAVRHGLQVEPVETTVVVVPMRVESPLDVEVAAIEYVGTPERISA